MFKNKTRCIKPFEDSGRERSPKMRGRRGAETSAAFSRYTWFPAPCRGLSCHRELKCHPQAARQHVAAGWVEEGQTRQPGCQGQPQVLMETSCRLVRKGTLLLRLGESQKPLSLPSPQLLPPSPGLGQAVACEQKGAFVCLLCGDRALQ